DIHSIRKYALEQLATFHPAIKRLANPHEYPVGLELGLHKRKTEMILKAKGYSDS
ncbi:MAG: nicotinate phosphoribosyltransferase, partial [Chlorobiales bacterium]|nr:nicotinate phosphoribosyltransferase [Chlorobiales bacterium]